MKKIQKKNKPMKTVWLKFLKNKFRIKDAKDPKQNRKYK